MIGDLYSEMHDSHGIV